MGAAAGIKRDSLKCFREQCRVRGLKADDTKSGHLQRMKKEDGIKDSDESEAEKAEETTEGDEDGESDSSEPSVPHQPRLGLVL